TKVNDLPEYTDVLGLDEIEPRKREREEKQGTVLWWNFALGLGAINTKYGVARAHWTQVAPYPVQRWLVPGKTVQFKELVEPKQTGDHETKFKFEAIEVESI
ncbi:MAG: hypothetical protein HY226_04075, partial [Candidatus Vogelbacteria bacterium]|nr:hypothetical protein [Candidatus Vogelbacteria bacterium]